MNRLRVLGLFVAAQAFFVGAWKRWNLGSYRASDKGVERFRDIANRKRGKRKGR